MSDVNLVPLTDEEIDKLAMRDRLETIRSLWTTFNKEPTAQQLRFYADQFIKLPTGLLMDSVTLAIRNQRYNIAPTIRAVFDEVKGILKCGRGHLARSFLNSAGWRRGCVGLMRFVSTSFARRMPTWPLSIRFLLVPSSMPTLLFVASR